MKPLSIGFNVEFNEAIKAATDRKIELPEKYYNELQGVARQLAFSVAGLSSLDQLQQVKDSLDEAIKNGESFNSWRKRVTESGLLNLPKHRLDNIFRTNLQGQYMVGKWEKFERNKDGRPYLMYDAINDSRTRPAHLALDGIIRRIDDSFWATHSAPNGYRCRCSMISLTEDQAQARSGQGKGTDKQAVLPDGTPAKPDKGWEYSPRDRLAGVKAGIDSRKEKASPVLLSALDKKLESSPMEKAQRTPKWLFSEATILGDVADVQGSRFYTAAKAGDIFAASALVDSFISDDLIISLLDKTKGSVPVIASVQAVEGVSVNLIPLALASGVSGKTGWVIDDDLVQINKVGHTKSTGWHRLANQALFSGIVEPGKSYILVDDFIGQGGTIANLKGYIEKNGGKVIVALILAGKQYSATLKLSDETLTTLRGKHGNLEKWWTEQFGFGFDCLTESEARYLIRAEDANTIRNKLAQGK